MLSKFQIFRNAFYMYLKIVWFFSIIEEDIFIIYSLDKIYQVFFVSINFAALFLR